MKKLSSFSITLLLAVFLLSACAGPAKNLSVSDPWARPGVAGGNSAIYFVIINPSAQADTLLSVESDAAEMAMIHRSQIDESGVTSMSHQVSVEVPSGQEIIFEPGGLHIMLIGLSGELKTGDTISIRLTFKNAGVIPLDVTVREP